MWSAIASAAGSVIGNVIDRYNAKDDAKKAWQRNLYTQDKAFQHDVEMWNKQNEYNTPANQMKRLQEAGLNPNLMYSNGNVGNATSSPTMHMANAEKPTHTKFDIDFSKLMPLMQMENLNAQNKLINAQTIEAEERAKGVTLDNVRKGIDNEYLPQRYGAEIGKIKEETKNIPYSNPVKSAVKTVDNFLDNFNPMVDYSKVSHDIEYGYRMKLAEKYGKNWVKHYKKPEDRRAGGL